MSEARAKPNPATLGGAIAKIGFEFAVVAPGGGLAYFSPLNFSSENGSGSSAAERLCLACGLCCNGVIFADVRLQTGDEPERLRLLGLPLVTVRKPGAPGAGVRNPKLKFHQPCAAFDGCRCRIYADRPRYCREFECGLLKKVSAGRLQPGAALRVIRSARQQVDAALVLLRQLGDADEDLPLATRFRRTARRLTNQGLDRTTADRYGRLTLAIHDLNLVLGDVFYPGSVADKQFAEPPATV